LSFSITSIKLVLLQQSTLIFSIYFFAELSMGWSQIVLPKVRACRISEWTLTLGLFLLVPLASLPTKAVELGDGRTFFDRTPRLIRTAASIPSPGTPSTYQFTIVVPPDAGEPMKAVTITQKPNLEQIRFERSKSRAFKGDSFDGGVLIPLSQTSGSEPSSASEVTVVFDKPIEPGTTVTVAIRARQNPRLGGVYLFGVTAFPTGENSPGLYLGSGRLHFTAPGVH